MLTSGLNVHMHLEIEIEKQIEKAKVKANLRISGVGVSSYKQDTLELSCLDKVVHLKAENWKPLSPVNSLSSAAGGEQEEPWNEVVKWSLLHKVLGIFTCL